MHEKMMQWGTLYIVQTSAKKSVEGMLEYSKERDEEKGVKGEMGEKGERERDSQEIKLLR